MSYKDVLRIFKLERDLSDDEMTFLNTLRQMSESERELLAEIVGPVVKAKSTKPATKRVIEKCADPEGCGLTRRAVCHKDSTHDDYHEFIPSPDIANSAVALDGKRYPVEKPKRNQRRGMPSSSQPPRCVVCFEVRAHENHNVETGHEFTTNLAKRVIGQLAGYEYCAAMVDDNGGEIACRKTMDDNIHHKPTDPDYHEFVGSKTVVVAGG